MRICFIFLLNQMSWYISIAENGRSNDGRDFDDPCKPCSGIGENDEKNCNCNCPVGFFFNTTRHDCEEDNESFKGQPRCQKAHVCVYSSTEGFKCQCEEVYENESMRYKDDIADGECSERGKILSCGCKKGFTIVSITYEDTVATWRLEAACQDIDECSETAFGCSDGDCQFKNGSLSCRCRSNEQSSVNIKASYGSGNGLNRCPDGICVNTPGSFRCSCSEGFNPYSGQCTVLAKCGIQPNICTNGLCEIGEDGFRCQCKSGFTLVSLAINITTGGRKAVCRDIDECREYGLACAQGDCEIQDDTLNCNCESGESHALCEDTNECDLNPSPCPNQICLNTHGSYICQCFPGYQQTPAGDCIAGPETTTEHNELPETTFTVTVDSSTTTQGPFPHESDSSTNSLPAIVSPLVAVIIVLALVGILLWRKLYMTNKKRNRSDSNSKKTSKPEGLEREGNVRNNINGNGLKELEGNSEEEVDDNAYSTIDVIDMPAEIESKENLNEYVKIAIGEESNTDSHEYQTLGAQNLPFSKHNIMPNTKIKEDCQTSRNQGTKINNVDNEIFNGQSEDGNNYLVLVASASNSLQKKCKGDLTEDRRETVNNDFTSQKQVLAREGHDYFILESTPIRSSLEVHNKLQTNSGEEAINDVNADRGERHDYFILTPPNGAVSQEEKNPTLQTLPDGNYNVLDMKRPVLDQDHNALKSEDCMNHAGGEYSSIKNNPAIDEELEEYSHISLNSKEHDTRKGYGDDYSHLHPPSV